MLRVLPRRLLNMTPTPLIVQYVCREPARGPEFHEPVDPLFFYDRFLPDSGNRVVFSWGVS
jgi:hypothetical protein